MSRFRQLMIANRRNKYPANATVWQLTIPEGGANYQFFIRNRSSSSVVDWGDGSVETISATGDRSPAHTYPAGSYTVSLTGTYDLVHIGSGNATYGKLVTRLVQVSEELTDYSSLCKHCAITELPTRFTIPYGVDNVSGMFESCKIPYLPDGFSLPETVLSTARMFYGGGLKSIPQSFILPRSVKTAAMMFWAIGTLSFDIEWFLQKITAGCALQNLEGAFGTTGITGTAPIERLSSISTITKYSNCFSMCSKLDNFAEITPTWGGGALVFDDRIIETSSTVDVEIAKINVNFATQSYQANTRMTSGNLPDGLELVFNYANPNNGVLRGTLTAGTYVFDATLSNKWSSATATITLIVDGGGGSGGGLKVSGVMATMAAMITPAFSFADGNYSLLDASATGNSRVWKLENGGTAFYFRWSETELAWTLAETEEDPAMIGFPYIYSTVNGNDPWTSSNWEFSLTGPVSIEVTQV